MSLDHATHEVSMIAFTYEWVRIRDVVSEFSSLLEPSQPISPEFTQINRLRRRGGNLDIDRARSFDRVFPIPLYPSMHWSDTFLI